MEYREIEYDGEKLNIPRLAHNIRSDSGATYLEAAWHIDFSVEELSNLLKELWIHRINANSYQEPRLHAACDIVRSRLEVKVHKDDLVAKQSLSEGEARLGRINVCLTKVMAVLTAVLTIPLVIRFIKWLVKMLGG